MDRISAPGATVDRRFTDGEPSSGTPATDVNAAWLNLVQEELVTPILASGRELDPGDTSQLMKSIIDLTYAIGDYIQSENDESTPVVRFPWQTWVEVKGVVLVGRDTEQVEFNLTGKTGGTKTHTLTAAQIPAHVHNGVLGNSKKDGGQSRIDLNRTGGLETGYATGDNTSQNSGEQVGDKGQPHPNLQPYRVVRMWKRTA